MAVSLHDAAVKSYVQTLGALSGMLDKAEAHCRENGLPDSAVTEARLAEDMWPFAKQVFECGHHSARAIAAVRVGEFNPEPDPVTADFAALRAEVSSAIALLSTIEPDELDAIADRDMLFRFGDFRLDFTVSDFLLSFSLPNFHFHATTAYAILRNLGISVGKRDYIGRLRIKPGATAS